MHRPMFTADFAPSLNFPPISTPLPLPQVRREWGLATLILRLKFDKLMKVLMLLLLEKPLLVVGIRTDEVSICTCTLLHLLAPYKWASVFINILPDNNLDFVESPVPFIAGVLAGDEKEVEMILNDFCVQQALHYGLSVVDLYSGEVHFTKEVEFQNMLIKCDSILTTNIFVKMSNYEQRLRYLVTKEDSTLLSLKLFIEYGASSSESVVLKNSLQSINSFIKSVAGDMQSSYDAWKKYSFLNEDNEIIFLPNRLLQPLQDKLVLLENMVETQLFSAYIEDKVEMESDDMFRKHEAEEKTIAMWVRRYWKKRRTC